MFCALESKLAVASCAPCADTGTRSGNDSRICITASAFATQAARKSTYVNVKKNNTSGFSPRDVRDTIYIARTIIISIRVMRVACRDASARSFVGDLVTPYSPRVFQRAPLV